jgi:hypothetical protein
VVDSPEVHLWFGRNRCQLVRENNGRTLTEESLQGATRSCEAKDQEENRAKQIIRGSSFSEIIETMVHASSSSRWGGGLLGCFMTCISTAQVAQIAQIPVPSPVGSYAFRVQPFNEFHSAIRMTSLSFLSNPTEASDCEIDRGSVELNNKQAEICSL